MSRPLNRREKPQKSIRRSGEFRQGMTGKRAEFVVPPVRLVRNSVERDEYY